jgi:hypothetical protein
MEKREFIKTLVAPESTRDFLYDFMIEVDCNSKVEVKLK